MDAWLMITTNDPVLLGAGYDDDAARYYSWDDTVQLHAAPTAGDAIVLWDKKHLLGVSVIDKIDITPGKTKERYRCPHCRKTKMQVRKIKKPPYWCPECQRSLDAPLVEPIEVTAYKSIHESSWIDLEGELTGGQLRQLCFKPKSQGSIRKLDWNRFQLSLGKTSCGPVKKITSSKILGGHTPRLGRARRGQTAFRKTLIEQYGYKCALSGAAPSQALDAAHLYSYAEIGMHDEFGGLLIRKDLHRLFDIGLIVIEPKTMLINVDEALSSYPIYQSLNGARIAVDLAPKTKFWIKQHWDLHRGLNSHSR